jgi:alpha-1,3/alpha-1,6-mannosyltransferase
LERRLESCGRANIRVAMRAVKPPFRIAFIHPDLGIGGAERLVVDAATHLTQAGHRVVVYTSHHDRDHCFAETVDGRLEVRVFQRLRAPFAIARMHYLAAWAALNPDRFDFIFCDLVPHAIPTLRILTRAKIIFYCHFPDKFIAPQRVGWYRWYRTPIDSWEQVSTGMAHRVVVNSKFTAAAFRRAFPRLQGCPFEVIYPGVDVPDSHGDHTTAQIREKISITSIARYERSKNVRLAIEAVAHLRTLLGAKVFNRIELVVAGGFDERLAENQKTIDELQTLTRRHGLESQVLFLKSVPERELRSRLTNSLCLVHTAIDEHFGYVPLEAMAAGRPVVVANCGGPAETVIEGETGFLRPPTPEAFADALARLITNPEAAFRMGRMGREHVRVNFSRHSFGTRLERLLEEELAGFSRQTRS